MRIFFSVGEPSGDQHAAHLIQELRRRNPHVEAVGFGGPLMESAGCRLIYRMTDLAIMGIFSVFPMLLTFWRLHRQAKQSFDAARPDAVVLIDFPGFNWHVARAAKQRGIPVYYYMPPQLWAWAPWRLRKVHKYVDHVISGLTFEYDWYTARGVKATYSGHPFFDEIADHQIDADFLRERQVAGVRNVGILPGSRTMEVTRNGPALLRIMSILRQRHPDVTFRVACYREAHREQLQQLAQKQKMHLPEGSIEFCVGKTSEIIELAECCLMVSGSVSLEMLGRKTPAVVIYKGGPLAQKLARWVLTCRYITLPNLLADRMVMPEYFYSGDDSSTVARITRIIDNWLSNPAALAAKQMEMAELADRTARTGATHRVAETLLTHLGHVENHQTENHQKAAA